MEMIREVTTQLVREFLTYDPETGVFVWRHRALDHFKSEHEWKRWNTRYATKLAGAWTDKAYLVIKIFRQDIRAHRLAWKYMTGDWPKGEIDHIDGNTRNNKWANLRDVSKAENQKNQKTASNNTSGALGVAWHKQRQKWCAVIISDNRRYWLGLFDEKADAIAARKAAEQRFGFHENHGRSA